MSEVGTKTKTKNGNGTSEQGQAWEPGRDPEASAKYLPPSQEWSLRSFRDEAEIHAIGNALKKTGWNRRRAARLLSISYRGLLYKMRRHNITPSGQGQLKAVNGNGDVEA